MLTFLPGLLRPPRRPGAFVSDASPVSKTLLVLCVNQGISASFSLSLSYRRLCTTRFLSVKRPQQNINSASPGFHIKIQRVNQIEFCSSHVTSHPEVDNPRMA